MENILLSLIPIIIIVSVLSVFISIGLLSKKVEVSRDIFKISFLKIRGNVNLLSQRVLTVEEQLRRKTALYK